MAPTFQLCGSVGGRAQKRDNGLFLPFSLGERCPPALDLMTKPSVLPWMPTMTFKWLPWCWSSEEVRLCKSMCGFFKENCLGLQKCLLLIQFLLGFVARSYLDYLPSSGTLSLGTWCVAEIPCSWDIPSNILSTTPGCRTGLFHVSAPCTSLDGCGFFNSVVVRLPINLISDGSEWWWFSILVVILMWLCKGKSHVYLCSHLVQKSLSPWTLLLFLSSLFHISISNTLA